VRWRGKPAGRAQKHCQDGGALLYRKQLTFIFSIASYEGVPGALESRLVLSMLTST
jgi:hypothetical protein